jgi:hypothetical protein
VLTGKSIEQSVAVNTGSPSNNKKYIAGIWATEDKAIKTNETKEKK